MFCYNFKLVTALCNARIAYYITVERSLRVVLKTSCSFPVYVFSWKISIRLKAAVKNVFLKSKQRMIGSRCAVKIQKKWGDYKRRWIMRVSDSNNIFKNDVYTVRITSRNVRQPRCVFCQLLHSHHRVLILRLTYQRISFVRMWFARSLLCAL